VFADENDQVWLTGSVKWKATDSLLLKLAEQFRYKDEAHTYRHTDLGVGYALNKNWSVIGTYRYVEKKNTAGEWQGCDGILFDVENTVKGKGVELKSRIRLAYFDPNYNEDCSTDFRPKFTLSPAKGTTGWKMKPYVADEIMYGFDEDRLYRNRLSVGLKFKPVNLLSVDLFVMQECTEKTGGWIENWNSGLSATFTF
jgi:hypothetical protein